MSQGTIEEVFKGHTKFPVTPTTTKVTLFIDMGE
jgi:hypothetical protein